MTPNLLAGVTAQVMAGLMASPDGRYVGVDGPSKGAAVDLSVPATRAALVAQAVAVATEILRQTGATA